MSRRATAQGQLIAHLVLSMQGRKSSCIASRPGSICDLVWLIVWAITSLGAIRFWNFIALGTKQKPLLHFSEARATILVVKQVEYGGHDRNPRFLLCSVTYHASAHSRGDLDHNLSPS
jgi:hypothetical protein